MSKLFLLGANKEIDRANQVVEVGQIIRMEGSDYYECVVYDIQNNEWGILYKLINLKTKDFLTTEIIQPLKEKFGIGYYYDSENLQFMEPSELAKLVLSAVEREKKQEQEQEQKKREIEQVREIGRKRFSEILPKDVQGIIVARLNKDESDIQTDYFARSVQRSVILGFSKHKRNIFSEMRKYAANFEETKHLAEKNKEYEHRENYSMGAGYYLGESKYSGWTIEKVSVYKRENTIEEFAYIAGNEENIKIDDTTLPNKRTGESKGGCILVEYSAKAVAVFGETKPIKEDLKSMGGRFNSRLTFEDKKMAGWIFPKSKEESLAHYFGLK